MDKLQEKHERAVGDAFIDWYNKQIGTSFAYFARGTEAPDLIYRDGTKELLPEITVAYYDAGHATMLWKNARGLSDAPDSWSSKEPDEKLIDSITLTLAKKSAKAYPSGCVLLVIVYPDLTDAEEFAALTPERARRTPFCGDLRRRFIPSIQRRQRGRLFLVEAITLSKPNKLAAPDCGSHLPGRGR